MNEWETELDRRHWIDRETGLDCLIVRNPHCKNLCGYVGVPKGHPWYGREYEECDADVHGGLTFASKCQHGGKICHGVEKDGEIANDDVWWLGFDCAHGGDLVPGVIESLRAIGPLASYHDNEVYRNIAYVERECRSLAKQAIAAQVS